MLRKSSAFTLIELLVVIAIIAILASLAIPALTKAMERSRALADANVLSQLGKGMAIYLSDNDDTFPSANPGATVWTTALNPKYISSWKPFQSPFDKRSPSEVVATAPVSYGLNSNISGRTVSNIVSSSVCILMAPVMSNPSKLQFGGTANSPSALLQTSNGSGNTGGTHSGGKQINTLFADTHVSPMSMSDFHASVNNPDTASTIKDMRWNK